MVNKSVQDQIDGIDKKMSLAERESVQRDLAMGEGMAASAQGLKSIEADPRVKRELIRKRMLLAKDDELASIGAGRSALEEEQKRLREVIKKNIPTKSEMWPGKDQSDKNRALQHNLEFQRKFQDTDNYRTPEGKTTSVVRRWQENERRLHPENPFAGNLDELRDN